MKQTRLLLGCFTTVFCMILLQTTAFANSSWRWISETRPYDVLPWVALVTIVLETAAIARLTGTPGKTLTVVILANLLSFAAPYVWHGLSGPVGFLDNLMKGLEHWPLYTVGLVYLAMTLAVELPSVYFSLKNQVEQPKKLLYAIVGSNVLTTIITTMAEHLLCRGRW